MPAGSRPTRARSGRRRRRWRRMLGPWPRPRRSRAARGVVIRSATTSMPSAASALVIASWPPRPNGVVDPTMATRARRAARPSGSCATLRHRGRLRERRAEQVGVALARDARPPRRRRSVGRCATCDVLHGRQHHVGEHRPHHRVGLQLARLRARPPSRHRAWSGCRASPPRSCGPRMPPAALISSNASWTPLLKLLPATAPSPDSSTALTTTAGAGVLRRHRQRAAPARAAASEPSRIADHALTPHVRPTWPVSCHPASGTVTAPGRDQGQDDQLGEHERPDALHQVAPSDSCHAGDHVEHGADRRRDQADRVVDDEQHAEIDRVDARLP